MAGLPAWFTQNGWASVVDSTADFLNSVQLSPFVRVTGNDGFLTKSYLTKRLHSIVETWHGENDHGKINAIWRNFKINVQKLADICGYKLPTNLQKFMQKGLTEVKIFLKVLWVGLLFETPCTHKNTWPSHSKGQIAYSVKSSVIIQTPKNKRFSHQVVLIPRYINTFKHYW